MFAFGNVLDRESFLFLLDLEIRRAQRYQNFLSLLSLTFGHLDPLMGEDASISMKTLANLVKCDLRETDIVGQGSGNLLLVMLPYADMAGAHTVRERLKRILYEYGFGRKGFTVEIKEVCFPTHATNLDDLLRMAVPLEPLFMSTPLSREGDVNPRRIGRRLRYQPPWFYIPSASTEE